MAAWHAQPIDEAAVQVGADLDHGLSAAEAAHRLATVGPNVLARRKAEPWWEPLAEALSEPLVLLLVAVGVLYAIFGELRDALTILVVILAVAGVEAFNERRAKRAIGALRSLSAPSASVLRDGTPASIPASDLMPGDLVLLRPGERVPADLRLAESVALRVDESSLTGESVPVSKGAAMIVPADAELGDRHTMAYAGTLVVAGKARGLAVATGPSTELGHIAALTQDVREPRTPLQRQMRQLAGWLLWLALGFSVLVPVLGVLVARRPVQEMLLTGLTLAFATIPEELPILITIVLGVGAYQLARRHAIVKRLRAAETLGGVSVVGTDKTGTLTENRLQVAELYVEGETVSPGLHAQGTAARLLQVGALANDAQLARRVQDAVAEIVGDPTDAALLAAAQQGGVDVFALTAAPVAFEFPFDDDRKRVSVVVATSGAYRLASKGAPEALLSECSTVVDRDGRAVIFDDLRRTRVQTAMDGMTARGLRVLAFAERQLAAAEIAGADARRLECDLTLVGLAGLEDPPRRDAGEAVSQLLAAGVRVLMLTGDHPATARSIARAVGIPAELVVRGRDLDGLSDAALLDLANRGAVFARITPEHKLRVVRALQAAGAVVAVTGDGVNDGPALREAAVGVAMGRSGTDVAREAADVVLADDRFATIAVAVRAGRVLFANLRKAVRFYLAAKVALITASLVAVLAQLPVPFSPVQIIVLELFMDLGASATFVAESPERDVMAQPPRDPRAPFLDVSMQAGIFAGGLSLAAAVLVSYLWAYAQGLPAEVAQTTAFAAWMISHLVLAAHMRSERQLLLQTPVLANPQYVIWVVGALMVLVLGVAMPALQERLHLAPLTLSAWAAAVATGLVLPSWWELWKWIRLRQHRTA